MASGVGTQAADWKERTLGDVCFGRKSRRRRMPAAAAPRETSPLWGRFFLRRGTQKAVKRLSVMGYRIRSGYEKTETISIYDR